jgi:hypothetical protein
MLERVSNIDSPVPTTASSEVTRPRPLLLSFDLFCLGKK